MATNKIKKQLKNKPQRTYLARDFDGFRAKLLEYARLYFPDKIQDFSESSLGGLLLDMVSFVGDTSSYYLDHQFKELDYLTAVEQQNIQRHIRTAGIKVSGAAPAVVDVTFSVEVDAVWDGVNYVPDWQQLPIIKEGARLVSEGGIVFSLLADLNLAKKDNKGLFLANYIVSSTSGGSPLKFVVSREGLCLSGEYVTETHVIPDISQPFRIITLGNQNITKIAEIKDSDDNVYYEVDYLTQDTVFKAIPNYAPDSDEVENSMQIIPAPYRYMTRYDYNNRMTSIKFGAGDATTLDNDILPDPAELGLPLYGKKTFGRFNIDPNALLNTQTLGISPRNTTLTITYRYGGGLDHNVSPSTIRSIVDMDMQFNPYLPAATAMLVRISIAVNNRFAASGGGRPPTLDELKSQIPSARSAQSRIVSKQDLLARIYTLPNEFGRVYRVGIRNDPINPLSSLLFLCTLDKSGHLTYTTDTLKKNLRKYLNEFRLISDAMDILDARIINFAVEFDVVSFPAANKTQVAQTCIANIQSLLARDNIQIDQPIALSDLMNSLLNSEGVMSVLELRVVNRIGTYQGQAYNTNYLNIDANTFQNMVVGPAGSIFELKYPAQDIVATVR